MECPLHLPVPFDHILAGKQCFVAPDISCMERAFRAAHTVSERLYAGQGIWVAEPASPYPPNVRETSRRVIGYLGAYEATGNDFYRERACDGLHYLRQAQNSNGSFMWHRASLRGIVNHNDGLYETGIAGVAFVRAYNLWHEDWMLACSAKASAFAMQCAISPNMNYNLFAVWHLAEHYMATGNRDCLDAAITKTIEGALSHQLSCGRWLEHNSWIWYHDIIIRGLAALYGALPAAHSFRPRLQQALIGAINRWAVDQTASGAVPPNPDPSENQTSRDIGYHRNTFTLHALCLVCHHTNLEVANILNGVAQFRTTDPTLERLGRSRQLCGVLQVPGAWAERHRNGWLCEPRTYPDERLMFHDTLAQTSPVTGWGELPAGWFPAWHIHHEPQPGQACWFRCTSGRNRPTCLVLQIIGKSYSGMGTDIGSLAGQLNPLHRYRLDAWVKAECTTETEALISLGVCTGAPNSRNHHDLWTSTHTSWESVGHHGFFQITHWWQPAPAGSHLIYLSLFVTEAPANSVTTLWVDELSLYDEGQAGNDAWRHFDDGDAACTLMSAGEYLRLRGGVSQ